MGSDPSALPLQPHMFFVMLALHGEPLHGYGIKKEVAERTKGAVDLDAGGLYRLIARLEERGWVEPSDADPTGDGRRKYYELTEAGRAVLAAEARRLADLVRQPDVLALADR